MKLLINIRSLLFCLLLIMLLPNNSSGQQLKLDTQTLQLANQYYRNQDFDKAAAMYKEIYEISGSQHYFNLYLNCLVEMDHFEEATDAIKKQLRKRGQDPQLYVQWGYLLKQQNLPEQANEKFQKALDAVPAAKRDYSQLASSFLSRREYELAEQVYLQGRHKLTNEPFHYELARVYLYQRNYELMFQEYLQLLKEDEKSLGRVQSSMLTAFRMDVDDSLRDEFRTSLLRQIQKHPEVIAYNRLLIWLFVQEKRFSQALRQATALDKRTGTGEAQIVNLATIAAGNEGLTEALKAYDYLIAKGEQSEFFQLAHQGKMQVLYQQFLAQVPEFRQPEHLQQQFDQTFQVVGFTPETTPLITDYAHFLAFYKHQPVLAIEVLTEHMNRGGISRLQRDQLKNELGDIQVLKNDLWEAILIYSQIIDANKNNQLGDEVKFKKARLGYFMGNLSWAQAQLDVLKASTSKLIANDALELSIFISSNTALDTTTAAMQLFAKADLYAFRNQDSLAWAMLDSIETNFSYNSLLDDVYFRKAKMGIRQANYEQAVSYLEKITADFSHDLLGDDALFILAQLYEQQLNQPEKAADLYKQMLSQHPGSIYVEEAREKYRHLRAEEKPDQETLFLEGQEVN
ncbi:tetratricopeptide repeat protein [Sunxiuqinia elliptica]